MIVESCGCGVHALVIDGDRTLFEAHLWRVHRISSR